LHFSARREPYKGASAVLTDMLAGQIQAGFETTSVLFGHLL